MEMSPEIASLAAALSKAQGEIEDATKDGVNPAFGKPIKYANLASVRSVIRGPLSKHGLSVLQLARAHTGYVEVTTMLMHSSGEYIKESLNMPTGQKSDAHAIGSAITYARRYGLMAILCLAADDDDGNAAVQAVKESQAPAAFSRAMKNEKDFV